MDINTLLKAAQHYYSERHSYLIKQLSKYSNQLKFSNHQNCLPYLLFKKNDIYLWINDPDVSDFPFLFTDPDDISFVLQSYFSKGNTLFISKEWEITLNKERIKEEIDKCLLTNNHEDFRTWAALYKNLQ